MTSASSTDGSISLLGDHEFISDNEGIQSVPIIPLTTSSIVTTTSIQPQQFWMRCQQPELTLILREPKIQFYRDADAKLSEIEATSDDDCVQMESITKTVATATTSMAAPATNALTVPESTLTSSDPTTELVRATTSSSSAPLSSSLKSKSSQDENEIFSFGTITILFTGFVFAFIAILYSWYAAPVENINELKAKLYSLQIENGNLNMKLERCRQMNIPKYEYSSPHVSDDDFGDENFDKYDSAGDRELIADNEIIDDISNESNAIIGISGDGDHIESSNERSKMVWTGEGNTLKTVNLSTEKHFKYEHLCDEEIHDDLFSEYITDYCKAIKKKKKVKTGDKKSVKRPIHVHTTQTDPINVIENTLEKIPVPLVEQKQPPKQTINFELKEEIVDEKYKPIKQYDLLRPPLIKDLNVVGDVKETVNKPQPGNDAEEDETFVEKSKLINQYDLPRPKIRQIEEFGDEQKPKLVNQYDLPRQHQYQREEFVQSKHKSNQGQKDKKNKENFKIRAEHSGHANADAPSSNVNGFQIKDNFIDPNDFDSHMMRQFDFDFDYQNTDTINYPKMDYEQFYMDDTDDILDDLYARDAESSSGADFIYEDEQPLSSSSSLSFSAQSCHGDVNDNSDACIGVTLSRKEEKKMRKKQKKDEQRRRESERKDRKSTEKMPNQQKKKERKPYKRFDD